MKVCEISNLCEISTPGYIEPIQEQGSAIEIPSSESPCIFSSIDESITATKDEFIENESIQPAIDNDKKNYFGVRNMEDINQGINRSSSSSSEKDIGDIKDKDMKDNQVSGKNFLSRQMMRFEVTSLKN